MATFTWTPDFNATQASQPRVSVFKAGDGYEQRIRFGLNADPKQWDLSFTQRTDTERDEITAFLEARKGAEPFDWTPPSGAPGKYVCESWQVTLTSCDRNTVQAKFRQVFDL